jgi:hypothetical protein
LKPLLPRPRPKENPSPPDGPLASR